MRAGRSDRSPHERREAPSEMRVLVQDMTRLARALRASCSVGYGPNFRLNISPVFLASRWTCHSPFAARLITQCLEGSAAAVIRVIGRFFLSRRASLPTRLRCEELHDQSPRQHAGDAAAVMAGRERRLHRHYL